MNSQVRVEITPAEIKKAKALAHSQGMRFQYWLGQLIKSELEKPKESSTGVTYGNPEQG